jgi:hypothetical protein
MTMSRDIFDLNLTTFNVLELRQEVSFIFLFCTNCIYQLQKNICIVVNNKQQSMNYMRLIDTYNDRYECNRVFLLQWHVKVSMSKAPSLVELNRVRK